MIYEIYKKSKGGHLVNAHKSARLRESGLLDDCAPQILRCAQDDSLGWCHPERMSRSPEERRLSMSSLFETNLSKGEKIDGQETENDGSNKA